MMEEQAQIVLADIDEFMKVGEAFDLHEHKLEDYLGALEVVLMHLDERLSYKQRALRNLNKKLMKEIEVFRGLLESHRMKDLKFEEEEMKYFEKLKEDIKLSEWRATRMDVDAETGFEKKVVRLTIDELSRVHSFLKNILKLMKRCRRLVATLQNGELKAEEDRYFYGLYKAMLYYSHVFSALLDKERKLFGKVRKS